MLFHWWYNLFISLQYKWTRIWITRMKVKILDIWIHMHIGRCTDISVLLAPIECNISNAREVESHIWKKALFLWLSFSKGVVHYFFLVVHNLYCLIEISPYWWFPHKIDIYQELTMRTNFSLLSYNLGLCVVLEVMLPRVHFFGKVLLG